MPLLPILGALLQLSYARKVHGAFESDFSGRCFTAVVTVVLSIAQWFGMEIVGVGSVLVIVITMIPFAIMVFMGRLSRAPCIFQPITTVCIVQCIRAYLHPVRVWLIKPVLTHAVHRA